MSRKLEESVAVAASCRTHADDGRCFKSVARDGAVLGSVCVCAMPRKLEEPIAVAASNHEHHAV